MEQAYIVNMQETLEGSRRLTVMATSEAEAVQKATDGFPDAVVISARPRVAYTPGPWRILTRRPAIRITTEGSPNVEPENVAQIALAEFRDATPEQLANARLMAAAPELLEALEGLRKAFGGVTTHAQQAAWETASAAITKALES